MLKNKETEKLQAVVFRVGQELYALPVADVSEVRRFEPLTPLPESPSFVAGVLRLRGHIVAVTELGKKLNKTPTERSDKTRIIIIQQSGDWAGLMVDEVLEVIAISKQTLQDPPSIAHISNRPAYVSALVPSEGRLILLLDVHVLLEEVPSHA